MPDQISALGIQPLFLSNCSVMFFLIVAEVIIAGILFALAKLISSCSAKLASFSIYLIKEGLLTLMMFNAFNIAFGVSVHFHYAETSTEGYLINSMAAILASCLIFLPCILLMCTSSKQFGEFKNKLKPDLMCQLYFVFALVFRFSMGCYTAVKTNYSISSLVMVGFCMLWVMYNLVNLPFRQAYQNYRANVCHIAQLIILMVTNYYDSMLETEFLEKKAYKFTAAKIEMWAIYACVGVSIICLLYDLYVFIREKCTKKCPSNKVKS